MGLQGYVGSQQDKNRIRRQEKQREEQKKIYEELRKKQADTVDKAGIKEFGASTQEVLEAAFKNETIGLVTREEFMTKRATLEDRLEEEARRRQREAEEKEAQEAAHRKRQKTQQERKQKISFMADDEEDEDAGAGEASQAAPLLHKFGKNPTVATDFLPDRERERKEDEMRKALRQEWLDKQEEMKQEPLEITFSYWDGTGHRHKITVKKGDSIGTFLKGVREMLAPKYRELRHSSVSNMMYVKEDVIIPHQCTFYDLILTRARGKSGPLFRFHVGEDVRVTNDASKEKEDAHAGKVVERHWYDKNKHIFPASRWETYDPDKRYEEYSIYG